MEYIDKVRLNLTDDMMETEFISARKIAAATNMSHNTANLILKELGPKFLRRQPP
jgi:hypothetical protein